MEAENMSRAAYLLFTICTIAPGFQKEGNPPDAVREKDVYAIYSLMLSNPNTSHGPYQSERYLIAGTTVPGIPEQPCVSPPKERAAEFRDVLVDYERRKTTMRDLKPALSIAKPYVLLDANEVNEFIKERSFSAPGKTVPAPQFQGVTDLFRLSDVYFNRRGTLALTAISAYCGSLCGFHQWKVFEKRATGKWEELPWDACYAIAEISDPPGLKTR
jgi:hypothetical protein